MAANPSAVHAMEKYGNWTTCTGPLGEHGIVMVDGKYYDCWYIYWRDIMSEEDFQDWLRKKRDFELAPRAIRQR